MTDTDNDPIVIKKYANRRLYNTATASFVRLEDLHQMVKDGVDFTVRDDKTGRDITSSVLAQIIAEEEDNPYAYYFLGLMYEGGYGVPQEPKTALLYYTKATRYSCPEANIKLGECYRNGFGVEQSSKDAIRNYQKAAEYLPEANIYIG